MLRAARAGRAASSSVNSKPRYFFMAISILVGAVRAERKDVLHEPLVVGEAGLGLAARVLRADAAELRRAEVHHRARTARAERDRIEERAIGGGVDAARVEAVEAKARAPFGAPLVDALQVPPGLPRGITGARERRRPEELARLAAPEVFALELGIGLARIAVGRVLPDEIGDRDAAPAREGGVVVERAILGMRREPRESGAPALARADVAARMREHGPGPGAVARAIAA